MTSYEETLSCLAASPRSWLITGAAGFIGSHLVENLLALRQRVVGLDNFSTGSERNLEEVRTEVGDRAWRQFEWIKGDILDASTCAKACAGVDIVLHQAALGSVPESIERPLETHAVNVGGFLNVLEAARRSAGTPRVVYASSCAVYGDDRELPKKEERVGNVLSPYAASKMADEIYSQAYASSYRLELIGLRYFNVFGPRQNPDGVHAAVIPKWIQALNRSESTVINGDGETSRDFCYVKNIVQANIAAALMPLPRSPQVFNIGTQEQITLNALYGHLVRIFAIARSKVVDATPEHLSFRAGDIRHSLADISKAKTFVGYNPAYGLEDGLKETIAWHLREFDTC